MGVAYKKKAASRGRGKELINAIYACDRGRTYRKR